jgi:hypothetical protein
MSTAFSMFVCAFQSVGYLFAMEELTNITEAKWYGLPRHAWVPRDHVGDALLHYLEQSFSINVM